MAKKDLIVITNYPYETRLSLDELCEACRISLDLLNDLIEYEIIHPEGQLPNEWEFDLTQLKRARTALRLQHDFEMNLSGVSLVLDLLDEMENMRSRLYLLEKHFGR